MGSDAGNGSAPFDHTTSATDKLSALLNTSTQDPTAPPSSPSSPFHEARTADEELTRAEQDATALPSLDTVTTQAPPTASAASKPSAAGSSTDLSSDPPITSSRSPGEDGDGGKQSSPVTTSTATATSGVTSTPLEKPPVREEASPQEKGGGGSGADAHPPPPPVVGPPPSQGPRTGRGSIFRGLQGRGRRGPMGPSPSSGGAANFPSPDAPPVPSSSSPASSPLRPSSTERADPAQVLSGSKGASRHPSSDNRVNGADVTQERQPLTAVEGDGKQDSSGIDHSSARSQVTSIGSDGKLDSSSSSVGENSDGGSTVEEQNGLSSSSSSSSSSDGISDIANSRSSSSTGSNELEEMSSLEFQDSAAMITESGELTAAFLPSSPPSTLTSQSPEHEIDPVLLLIPPPPLRFPISIPDSPLTPVGDSVEDTPTRTDTVTPSVATATFDTTTSPSSPEPTAATGTAELTIPTTDHVDTLIEGVGPDGLVGKPIDDALNRKATYTEEESSRKEREASVSTMEGMMESSWLAEEGKGDKEVSLVPSGGEEGQQGKEAENEQMETEGSEGMDDPRLEDKVVEDEVVVHQPMKHDETEGSEGMDDPRLEDKVVEDEVVVHQPMKHDETEGSEGMDDPRLEDEGEGARSITGVMTGVEEERVLIGREEAATVEGREVVNGEGMEQAMWEASEVSATDEGKGSQGQTLEGIGKDEEGPTSVRPSYLIERGTEGGEDERERSVEDEDETVKQLAGEEAESNRRESEGEEVLVEASEERGPEGGEKELSKEAEAERAVQVEDKEAGTGDEVEHGIVTEGRLRGEAGGRIEDKEQIEMDSSENAVNLEHESNEETSSSLVEGLMDASIVTEVVTGGGEGGGDKDPTEVGSGVWPQFEARDGAIGSGIGVAVEPKRAMFVEEGLEGDAVLVQSLEQVRTSTVIVEVLQGESVSDGDFVDAKGDVVDEVPPDGLSAITDLSAKVPFRSVDIDSFLIEEGSGSSLQQDEIGRLLDGMPRELVRLEGSEKTEEGMLVSHGDDGKFPAPIRGFAEADKTIADDSTQQEREGDFLEGKEHVSEEVEIPSLSDGAGQLEEGEVAGVELPEDREVEVKIVSDVLEQRQGGIERHEDL
eukprot:TRINITY_DN1145_c0_g1_i1.p1 TRINITY_DN1145_c0_g1~~TRINITY_DN1145_c0_g1_i1.p1  ORF type:complete len:1170 (-),score=295.88 TRINITY_DN1145_c0_g1_i1:304-3651(-)